MSPSLPLPGDDELPDDIRAGARQSAAAERVPRRRRGARRAFAPSSQLGGSLLAGARDRRQATARSRSSRVATETGAGYEWAQHEQLARNVGVSDAEIEAIRAQRSRRASTPTARSSYRAATEISRDVRISDEALGRLVERWGEAGRRRADPLHRLLQHGQPLPRVGRASRSSPSSCSASDAGRDSQARPVAAPPPGLKSTTPRVAVGPAPWVSVRAGDPARHSVPWE